MTTQGRRLSQYLFLYDCKKAKPDTGVLQENMGMGKSAKQELLTASLYFKCFPNLSSSCIKLFFLIGKSAGKHFLLEPFKHIKLQQLLRSDLVAPGDFYFTLSTLKHRGTKFPVQYTQQITARAKSITTFLPRLPSPLLQLSSSALSGGTGMGMSSARRQRLPSSFL